MQSTLCKLVQRQTYDVLSHKTGTFVLLGGIILLMISAFQFGEVAMEWSRDKYAAVFNSFSDNVAGKSFQNRLCLPVPIDVVYTWVNGSDLNLLADLKQTRANLERELNISRNSNTSSIKNDGDCTFSNCILANMVVLDSPVTTGMKLTLTSLSMKYPSFMDASKLIVVKSPHDDRINVSVAIFDNQKQVEIALNESVKLGGKNVTLRRAYLTSDWTVQHSILLHDTIIMSGFPHTYKVEDITEKLPELYRKSIEKIELFEDKGVAVLQVPDKKIFEKILDESNITLDGKEPTLNAANLVWDLNDDRMDEDISTSRFEDNEELRYSLRSIDRFAPWVRHIYIVTNGQIPGWLNLDHPRLTVVTHQDIFPNASHLPTFSSPAIESHLHRIPGLSDKFIYMNDDVMFGKEVWPDDFYTHAHGQKVYLTWPVPNCQEGCPGSWIKDGYCDKACNNTECDWDGGDCTGDNVRHSFGGDFGGGNWGHQSNDKMYCNAGCANNWIADRYCDQSCNVKECGFDAGDCGDANFHKMYRVDVNPNIENYTLPQGTLVSYFNLSAVFGANGTIEEGKYDENEAIRSGTMSQKFKTLHVILYEKHNNTNLHFTLKGSSGTEKVWLSFNVTINTNPVPHKDGASEGEVIVESKVLNKTSNITHVVSKVSNRTKALPFVFTDVPQDIRSPRVAVRDTDPKRYKVYNTSDLKLPENVKELLEQLEADFKQGDLTEKGYNLEKADIVDKHQEDIKLFQHQQQQEMRKHKDENIEENKLKFNGDHLNVHEQGNANVVNMENAQVDVKAENVDTVNKKIQDAPIEKLPNLQNEKLQNFPDKKVDTVENGEEEGGHAFAPEDSELKANAQENNNGGNNLKETDQPQVVGNVQQENQQRFQQVNQQPIQQQNKKQLQQNNELLQNNQEPLQQNQQQLLQNNQEPLQQNQQLLQNNQEPLQQNQQLLQNNQEPLQQNQQLLQNNQEPLQQNNQQLLQQNQVQQQNQVDNQQIQHKNEEQIHQVNQQNIKINEETLNQVKPAKPEDPLVEQNKDSLVGEQKEGEVHKSRILNSVGFLPWEKQGVFADLQEKKEAMARQRAFESEPVHGRHLLDTFGDSLRHVNKLYNQMFGYDARKVPGHMPHMIDKNIMNEMQNLFPNEWDVTSSHKIRHSKDMQFAFSFFYYVIGAKQDVTVEMIFDEMDVDKSGVLSDRELRTLATRLYELPLTLEQLTGIEKNLINCSQHTKQVEYVLYNNMERYYEKDMRQVTKTLVLNCEPIIELLSKNFKVRNKFKFEILGDDDIAFKMIRSNVSRVVGQLDDIRRNPKKFVCLNDNIQHGSEESKTVKAVLQDFYEGLFPLVSQFELPREYRNRFLHTDELRAWRRYRDWLKMWTHLALFILIMFTIASFFGDKIEQLKRKFWRQRVGERKKDRVEDV